MYWARKKLLKVLMVFLLSFSITATSGALNNVTVEAAAKAPTVKAPTIKVKDTTLYVGYKNYTIGFNNLAKGAAVSYKSNDTKVCTVSVKGVVIPVKAGTTVVIATVKQNKKTYGLKVNINVLDPYIEFTQSTTYLNVGDSMMFKAQAYGTDSPIEWNASDINMVSVGPTGRIAALQSGSVTIYADAGNVSAKVKMDIGTNRLGTFSKDITIYNDDTIWINVPDSVTGETLSWDSTRSDIVDCDWGDWVGDRCPLTIKPLAVGTDTITISTDQSNDKILINVTVINEPTDRVELNSKDIYKKCGPSTVELSVKTADGDFLGSGFFIGKGMIATNYHVIEGAQSIIVKTTENGNEREYNVNTIIGYDEDLDLAIIGIDKDGTSLVLSQDTVENGEDIYAIGSPLALTSSISDGIVSSVSRTFEDDPDDYIQFTAAASHGNSGGPLVNSYGEVVGIVTMGITDGQNLNFAINIKELQKINTNKPMTVSDYNAAYEKGEQDYLNSITMQEDPTVSQSETTCQTVPSGFIVNGALTLGEKGDNYKITVTKSCTFIGYIVSNNDNDMQNTYFSIWAENHYDKAVKWGTIGSNYHQYIITDLEPGNYILWVCPEDGYSGPDMDYTLSVLYE